MEESTKSISTLNKTSFCARQRELVPKFSAKSKPDNAAVQMANIERSAITAALVNDIRDKKAIANYIASRMDECGFKNDQQEELNTLWLVHYVWRYLRGESRHDIILADKTFTVDLGDDQEYRINGDIIFPDGNGGAEIVAFKAGNGKYDDPDARKLQLWANMLYLRALGYKGVLKSSFYYLKNCRDTTRWATCPPLLDSSQIESLTDIYTPDGKDTLRESMEEVLDSFKDGVEQSEMCDHDCEYCDYNNICNYKPAPIYIPAVPSPAQKVNFSMFSDEQKEAVEWMEGDARIIAVAGAGKTSVVVGNIVRLLEKGVKQAEVLVLTFTRVAAKVMKLRAESTLGITLDDLYANTIHGFALDIVREGYKELGYAKAPVAIQEYQEMPLIEKVLEEHPIHKWTGNYLLTIKGTDYRPGAGDILAACFRALDNGESISSAIVSLKGLSDIDAQQIIGTAKEIQERYEFYKALLKKQGLVSFNRMLPEAMRLFEEEPDFLEAHYGFKHIIVDESQDTSAEQMEFIRKFRDASGCESSMWVGDDFQAIYGFLGVGPDNIINLEDRLGRRITDICLSRNYRSVPAILDFASAVIKNNKNQIPKLLQGNRPDNGEKVQVFEFSQSKDALNAAALHIFKEVQNGINPSDILVLSYSKKVLRTMQDALTVLKIPTHFGAPENVLENARIQAVLKFARIIKTQDRTLAMDVAQALADGALAEMEKEEINDMIEHILNEAQKIRAVFTLAAKKKLFMDFAALLVKNDETVENLLEGFGEMDFDEILRDCDNLERFGNDVMYRRQNDYDGVQLRTIHSSKGDEAPYVIVLPDDLAMAYSKSDKVEEGWRLFYVACTRARDRLAIFGSQFIGRGKKQRFNHLMTGAKAALHGKTVSEYRETEDMDDPADAEIKKVVRKGRRKKAG